MKTTKNNPSDAWVMKISRDLPVDLESFGATIGRFKAQEISETEFRAVRVPWGIYEQRESGAYMIRVRNPAGSVPPVQLHRLGEVAAKWGNGVLHVTTRQEFQVHRVPLDSILPALRALAESGLSTRGGGGNTVRNITACFDSGVCPTKVFDVAPYAVATTERLLDDPLSLQLPRKYKIAFAACERDCCGATVHDAGFIARRRDGVDGFAVYVGGGMGGKSRLSSLLHEFIPASDALPVAEAIKRVFDKNGDRKNKHLARLRFLVERIGMDAFRALYEKELAEVRAPGPAPLELRPFPVREPLPASAEVVSKTSPAFASWFRNNVSPQKQPGYFLVHIPLELGDLSAAATAALAGIVASHGDGVLYVTQSQNAALRWIAGSELPALFDQLDGLSLAEPEPAVLRNLVSCAGASTCRLGICLSRGLAGAIRRELTGSEQDLEALGPLTVHISGCPNSCGRHPISNLGFSGAARRVEGNLVPFYAVQLGGRLAEGKSRLGANVGAVPAKNVPAFVRDLLAAWKKSPDAADFHQFVDHDGRKIASEILARYQDVPALASRKEFYYDWDADALFSLAGRGQGECSAGVFDLIEVDLANARESQEAGRFYAATLAAARALLVVQRAQPKSDVETFALFQKHFIEAGLVDGALTGVIAAGACAAATADPTRTFDGSPVDVATLVTSVRLLHESLDASLRFKTAAK